METDSRDVLAWRLRALPMQHDALLVLGLPLERTHGSIRLGLIYMVSGIFGFVMCAALSPHTITVGASGAIFGLIGAGLAEVILNWSVYPNPCRLLLQLALGAFVQLLIGTMPIWTISHISLVVAWVFSAPWCCFYFSERQVLAEDSRQNGTNAQYRLQRLCAFQSYSSAG